MMGGAEEKEDSGRFCSKPVVIKVRELKPREFQIRKEDAEKHGYTRGCGGCSSWFRGLARQAHTPACRERFRELMKDDARKKLAEQKKAEYDRRWEDKMWRKIIRREERCMEEGAKRCRSEWLVTEVGMLRWEDRHRHLGWTKQIVKAVSQNRWRSVGRTIVGGIMKARRRG